MLSTLALVSLLRLQSAPLADLPFEATGGRIYVKGLLGKREVAVIMDSGAGASVMDLGVAKDEKLPLGMKVAAGGVGKQTVDAFFLKDVNVVLSPTFSQPMMLALPLADLQKMEGRHLDTILGFQFFTKYVVDVDYQAKRVKVFAPEGYEPPKGATAVDMKPLMNVPHIQMSVTVAGLKYDIDAMVDTGASGGGLFTQKFLNKVDLASKVKTTAKMPSGSGVGGTIEGRSGRVDSFQVAGVSFEKPIVSIPEGGGGVTGATTVQDLILGSDVLSRFHVIFNYSKKQIYFIPNSDNQKPFEADKTGAQWIATGADLRTYSVFNILPASSAEAAGLQKGDELVSVDGRPAGQFTLTELRQLFKVAGKAWKLEVRRRGEVRAVTVEPKAII